MTCKRQYELILSVSIVIIGATFSVLVGFGIEIALCVGAFGTICIALIANKENHNMMWVSIGIFMFILTMI